MTNTEHLPGFEYVPDIDAMVGRPTDHRQLAYMGELGLSEPQVQPPPNVNPYSRAAADYFERSSLIVVADGGVRSVITYDFADNGEFVVGTIHRLRTEELYRRRGYARTLIERAEEDAYSLDVSKLVLSSSSKAINFYLNRGFQRTNHKLLLEKYL